MQQLQRWQAKKWNVYECDQLHPSKLTIHHDFTTAKHWRNLKRYGLRSDAKKYEKVKNEVKQKINETPKN